MALPTQKIAAKFQFLDRVLARFRETGAYDRLRIQAVGAYTIVACFSLLWGLSPILFYSNALDADIRIGKTSEGTTFLTISNGSSMPWTNVKIVADGTYFLRVDTVPPQTQIDSPISGLTNQYQIPRPIGMFFWDNVGEPVLEPMGPIRYVPERIRIEANEGFFEQAVSL